MNQFGLIDHSGHCWTPNQEKGRGGETPRRLETPGRLEMPRRLETPGRLNSSVTRVSLNQFGLIDHSGHCWTPNQEKGRGGETPRRLENVLVHHSKMRTCIQNSRIGAMPILQVKQVKRAGTILLEHRLDHDKNKQQSQGEARQEPRHPPARCLETRQKKTQPPTITIQSSDI